MHMAKRIVRGGCLLLLGAGFTLSGLSCRKGDDPWPSSGKKRVLASFPPLYCFAKNVAGDDADVRCLLTLQGPHDFAPTQTDVMVASKADLILVNGLGIDEWIATKLLRKTNKADVVEVAETIPED